MVHHGQNDTDRTASICGGFVTRSRGLTADPRLAVRLILCKQAGRLLCRFCQPRPDVRSRFRANVLETPGSWWWVGGVAGGGGGYGQFAVTHVQRSVPG